MNIYKIQQELLSVINAIEENEGELTPELEEQLTIKESEFKTKVESYTNVIKLIQNDIALIKAEKARLSDLQKSKENTIDRIKNVIIDAINMFGETSKTGTKFIDFVTGKVSIRKSESIELDDDSLKAFTNRFISYFNVINYQNTFDQIEYDCKEITDYCNIGHGSDFDEDCIQSNFTEDDLAKIQADLDIRVNLKDMISTESGRNLLAALYHYNNNINIIPYIDKKAIKDGIKAGIMCPTFAKHIIKDNVIIK